MISKLYLLQNLTQGLNNWDRVLTHLVEREKVDVRVNYLLYFHPHIFRDMVIQKNRIT